MKNIDILLDLEVKGVLKKMYRTGILPCKFETYKEIYLYVDAKKSVGIPIMTIISDVEEKFGVGQTTIYKALKLMNE
jgi:hypothetical protein